MRRAARVDLLMYLRALPLLARRPSLFVMPLLAAVLELAIGRLSLYGTDPLGGFGQGIVQFLVQLVYGFAFGVAIIQASDLWRGRRATFEDAWDEGRRKAGGILFATVGLGFVLFAAAYVGSILGGSISLALAAIAAFFMLYAIPAAAIGGLPGGLALSGSIRAARANIPATLVLAVVVIALLIVVPQLLVPYITPLGVTGGALASAAVHALIITYLALPFAKQYDDIAFRGLW